MKVEFYHYNLCYRQMSINEKPFKVETWCVYLRCIMIRPFVACHKYDLDLVFKVTTITESFHIWKTLKGGTNCHLWFWKILSWVKIHLLKNYTRSSNWMEYTSLTLCPWYKEQDNSAQDGAAWRPAMLVSDKTLSFSSMWPTAALPFISLLRAALLCCSCSLTCHTHPAPSQPAQPQPPCSKPGLHMLIIHSHLKTQFGRLPC